MNKTLTLEMGIWTKFARTCGARFDVERKALEAVKFCTDARARSFAVPSKLVGTSQFQDNIRYALPRLDRSSRKLSAEVTEDGRIALGFDMYRLGYVQKKHACWVRPLLESGLCFYLNQITGGTGEKKYHGVNVCFYNLREAIQEQAARMEPEVFARLIG